MAFFSQFLQNGRNNVGNHYKIRFFLQIYKEFRNNELITFDESDMIQSNTEDKIGSRREGRVSRCASLILFLVKYGLAVDDQYVSAVFSRYCIIRLITIGFFG